jgi:serine/threonine-protein kinase
LQGLVTAPVVCLIAALLITTTPAIAADYYGAIAYSPSTGAFGRAWDYQTRRHAERVALRHCRKQARDCQLVWFRNACGAVAAGNSGGWGSAWAMNERIASHRAMARCRQYDSGCRVRVWQCTSS